MKVKPNVCILDCDATERGMWYVRMGPEHTRTSQYTHEIVQRERNLHVRSGVEVLSVACHCNFTVSKKV